jgi:hypothetical protein
LEDKGQFYHGVIGQRLSWFSNFRSTLISVCAIPTRAISRQTKGDDNTCVFEKKAMNPLTARALGGKSTLSQEVQRFSFFIFSINA